MTGHLFQKTLEKIGCGLDAFLVLGMPHWTTLKSCTKTWTSVPIICWRHGLGRVVNGLPTSCSHGRYYTEQLESGTSLKNTVLSVGNHRAVCSNRIRIIIMMMTVTVTIIGVENSLCAHACNASFLRAYEQWYNLTCEQQVLEKEWQDLDLSCAFLVIHLQ